MSFVNNIAKRAFSTSNSPLSINKLTVIGCGLMGSGIAQIAAQAGHDVTIVDVNKELLSKSIKNIEKSLSRIAKKKFADNEKQGIDFVTGTMARLKTSTDTIASVADTDLVVEAIIENLEIKRTLFADMDAAAPQHTIFTSNTSSLSIRDIATSTSRLDRFGGLHFFNPVPIMKLLEVVRIPETSDQTFASLIEFGKSVKKTTVETKDTPGFIVNRLLVPFLMESIKMYERGDATIQDIDTAMKLGSGHPMGPLELADYIGLDTCHFIISGWAKEYPDNAMFKPSELLKKMVDEGKLGRKSGQGFYDYSK